MIFLKKITRMLLRRRGKMSKREREEQRRSFAFGNVKLSNEEVTRDMIDAAAERLNKDDGSVG